MQNKKWGMVASCICLLAGTLLAASTASADRARELTDELRAGQLANARRAMVELVRLGAPAVEPLIDCLDAGNQLARISAAEALGLIGDARAIDPLIGKFEHDDYAVRWAAAEALGRIGDARAVDPLVAALPAAQPELRGAIVTALHQIGDNRAVPVLVKFLKDENPETRVSAARVVGRLGGAEVATNLISCLVDGNAAVRQAAAEALGRLASVEAVDPLIGMLRDDNAAVRLAVAAALGRIGDPRAVTPLISALQAHDASQRIVVAGALGLLRDSAGATALTGLLRDERVDVRTAAIAALAQMGAAAVPELINSLNDFSPYICATAAQLLGQAGDIAARDPLIPLLTHRDADVRQASANALTLLGYMPDNLNEQVIFFIAAGNWDALYAAGEPAFDILVTRLQSSDSNERILTLTALENIGRRDMAPLLENLRHTNTSVRMFTAEALGRVGDPRAVEPLKALQGDDNEYVRKYAARALNLLGEKVPIPETTPIVIERAEVKAADTGTESAAPAEETATNSASGGGGVLGDLPLLTF